MTVLALTLEVNLSIGPLLGGLPVASPIGIADLVCLLGHIVVRDLLSDGVDRLLDDLSVLLEDVLLRHSASRVTQKHLIVNGPVLGVLPQSVETLRLDVFVVEVVVLPVLLGVLTLSKLG